MLSLPTTQKINDFLCLPSFVSVTLIFGLLFTVMLISCENSDEPDLTQGPGPNPPNPPDPPDPIDFGPDPTGGKPEGLPAFPGAEGFGSTTIGGRGGAVVEVTNLNDSGPGSFREAVETAGPRIVIFRTGGTIQLRSKITITEPFITIAGQTAPGDGITFRDADIRISTHDVILRGIRVRVGDVNQTEDWDGIVLHTPFNVEVYNVIVDHCSVSWAIDENISTFGLGARVRDCTFSYNISSEGLEDSHHRDGPHSKGMLLTKNNCRTVSVHHNLFAHNVGRNPKVALDVTAEVINNVVYNFGAATRLDPGSSANAIGNVYIPGPNTSPTVMGETNKGIMLGPVAGFPEMLLYVSENIGPGREINEGDDWLAVGGGSESLHRSTEPVPTFLPSEISHHSVDETLDVVLDNVGATAPHRDPVDLRLIQEVRSGTGRVINSQEDVGGWPFMDSGTAPTDTDGDGMPDEWEVEQGLDINDPSDGNLDSNENGYSNIEEYLNSFFEEL